LRKETVIHPTYIPSFTQFLMDHHADHPKQSSDRNSPIEPLHLIFDGLSDPEEDDIFDVWSFDEDDMYGSDNGDDIIVMIPEPDDDLETPSDDVIWALLESVDELQTSLVGMVCH